MSQYPHDAVAHEVERACGHRERLRVAPPFAYLDRLAQEIPCAVCRATRASVSTDPPR